MPQRHSVVGSASREQPALQRAAAFAMVMMASIQVVYFYIVRVPSYLLLDYYEHGKERMPFQGRMLMQYPLLWAHQSATLARAAAWITTTRMFLPRKVLPEDIVEFGVDIAALVFAGYVATKIYRVYSSRHKLLPYVYPVFLIMVVATYCLQSMNFYRYIYDLPSLGLFAAGLYFIYIREQTWLFAAMFILATANRETSIFLLLLFLQQRCSRAGRFNWSSLMTLRVGGAVGALALFWLGFRIWLTRHFGAPPPDIKPGIVSNMAALLWPYAWPQLAAMGAYTLPLVLLCRFPKRLFSEQLFAWIWVLPVWAVMMLVYGNLIEIRLFGELLPLMAPSAVLVAEEQLFGSAARAA